jgi:lysophospholipase L1-like esterase
MAKQRTQVPGRYLVTAASRHPRLGRDYDPATHKYADEYVNPRGYAIAVDAFPGKTLVLNRGDQPARPGLALPRDVYELDVASNTTGWEFSISGTVETGRLVGPPQKFSAKAAKALPTISGDFDDMSDNNAWNWRVVVPGPGTYTVSTNTVHTGGLKGPPQIHKLKLQDTLVVSIGDSAASGQGNPDVPGKPKGFDLDIPWWLVLFPEAGLYKLTADAIEWGWEKFKQKATTISRALSLTIAMDPPPTWLEPRAYRSLLSGHARGARLMEDPAAGTVVTFLPFGRTGSEIGAGLLGPRGGGDDGWINNIGQIDEVLNTVGRKRIGALLIQIGVNDVGVSGTLEDLLKMDSAQLAPKRFGTKKELQDRIRKAAMDNINDLPDRLRELKAEIDGKLNVRHVYLTEYPAALFDGDDGIPKAGCGIFDSSTNLLDLDQSDARLVKDLAQELNRKLKSEAGQLKWFYITGIARGFGGGHGYCAKDRYFRQAEESMVLQGDTEGTIHPNEEGAKLIGRRVAEHVKENTISVPDAPKAPVGPATRPRRATRRGHRRVTR